ncbi:MAG: ATP-binding cassette domain-containing protein, partial [Burkholderiales bacterium]
MAIITFDKASLAFGHHALLDKVSFGIEKNDKIGLIGRNGSGKSSLLKALAGSIALDDGQIYVSEGIKIVYVAQEPILDLKHTVFDEVFSGLGAVKDYLSEYYKVLDLLAHDYSASLLEQLTSLQEELEQHNAWGAKTMIDKTLTELGLSASQNISDLSGGVKKKVAIAKALVASPDVILLDEPTNHLDIKAIEWLEQVINDFPGTVMLITHDRSFLDKTVTKIVELDRGRLRLYPGSYAKYQQWKAQQLADEAKINYEFDKFLAQEEVWIRKGIEARRTRNEGRVRRLEDLRNQRAERRERVGKVNFMVDRGNLSGKLVAELTKVNLSFAQRQIIKDFTTTIMRGDKIGLIGPNGIGKSTLLKIILQQL